MKKLILFTMLLFISALRLTNAINISIEKNTPWTESTRPRIPMLIPVTVDLSTSHLCFNFATSVGMATITITDSLNSIVHQVSIDTDTNNELTIPVDIWNNGNYSMEISYGSITLVGSFELD